MLSVFIGVTGMKKQIAGVVPVQGELDLKHKTMDDTDHPSSFETLCQHPDTGVKKDIASVAIPSSN